MILSSVWFVLSACKPQVPVENNVVKNDIVEVKKVEQRKEVAELLANFSRVHFDTDSSQLNQEGKDALEANANILQRYPELKVEVQGHADERGTIDYNLALGQRRANSVITFLSSRGVATSRLPVVSYGEERPLAAQQGEVAWAQNRRAEFRVIIAPENVVGTIQ